MSGANFAVHAYAAVVRTGIVHFSHRILRMTTWSLALSVELRRDLTASIETAGASFRQLLRTKFARSVTSRSDNSTRNGGIR